MFLKKLPVIAIGLSLAYSSNAQVKVQSTEENEIPYYKNEVGLELGGNSIIYSAYYQRALYRKGNTQFNIRVGGSYVPGFDNYSDNYSSSKEFTLTGYVLPNVLFFHKRHAWEVGLGFNIFANFRKDTYAYYNNPQKAEYTENFQTYFVIPQVGYRAYFKHSKFYFRAAASIYIYVHSHDSDNEVSDVEPKVLPWGAVGFGYSFGSK